MPSHTVFPSDPAALARQPVATPAASRTDFNPFAAVPVGEVNEPVESYEGTGPLWRPASQALRRYLETPLMARAPVSYSRAFVDDYRPNETFLLPLALIEELTELGRIPDQQPAGTYLRRVLQQVLIDLSWSSSYLEGNSYTRMDTEALFQRAGGTQERDAIMLLNHKRAIEFMARVVPMRGLTPGVLRNVHSLLMDDLLADRSALGCVRSKPVQIGGSRYCPCEVPAVLQEVFEQIVHKAAQIRHPVEAAFFLWIQLAYLQSFEDGNKRISRMAANIPLILHNQAPLSFMDVTREDYALAMIGVYERLDVSLAVDLFDWTYRRSLPKYKQIVETMEKPDPFRWKHHRALSQTIGLVVQRGELAEIAMKRSGVPVDDQKSFLSMVTNELAILTLGNYARFRLSEEETAAWIEAGRPQ